MTRHRATVARLRSWQLGLLGLGIVALGLGRIGAETDMYNFYCGWLLGFLFCWEMSLGCLGLLMLHNLMGGNWGRASRPVIEAGASLMPLIGLAFLPIALNVAEIYPWAAEAAASDPLIAKKAAYLNVNGFWTRAVIYFAVWIITGTMLIPEKPRTNSDLSVVTLKPRRAALGLCLLIVTASFAAIDWGMSLEPHWFSAIYGAIYVVGGGVTALAVTILAVAALQLDLPVPQVARKRIRNDLGSLSLAMLMVWTYFAFSQFLIIWSANLPEEAVWYLARGQNGWQYLATLIVLLHFVAPFGLLLSQDVRWHPRALSMVAILVLGAHGLQLLWTIGPAFYGELWNVPWFVLVIPVGLISLWGAAWLFLLGRREHELTSSDGNV